MNYYFVGIKGSGMSGLAQILHDLGNEIKGADIDKYLFTENNLHDKNIKIESFNNMDYEDSDVIIVGNAYENKFDFKDKKVLTYQQALSMLNDSYYSIAVCGTHGKTTTTNMIKHVLSSFYPTNYLVGDGQGKGFKNAKYFVYEACEHRDHFLSYKPNICVCLNVDYDHVEYFLNKKQYKKSFNKFFEQTKDLVILNDSISYESTKKLSFGFNNANIKALNVKYKENGTFFSIVVDKKVYNNLFLPFYGKHILSDVLATIACCYKLNIDVLKIVDCLKNYKNAGRRYNITFVNSNVIVDDYGHHPKEIQSTISAIKQEFIDKKLYIIYHPDRPKRLISFLNQYKKVFNSACKTYVLPFLDDNSETKAALNYIVDNKNIHLFSDNFYNCLYLDCVFLFTGSKEMKEIIKKLVSCLS